MVVKMCLLCQLDSEQSMLMGAKVRGRGPIEYPECVVHSFGLDIKEPHTLVNPIKPYHFLKKDNAIKRNPQILLFLWFYLILS